MLSEDRVGKGALNTVLVGWERGRQAAEGNVSHPEELASSSPNPADSRWGY